MGEKLVNFLRAADERQEFAAELPNFVAAIKDIFEPHEIRGYLDSARRVGALGHVCSDEEHELFREHGSPRRGPGQRTEDILIRDRIREMLLG